jgi:hypothetical protein
MAMPPSTVSTNGDPGYPFDLDDIAGKIVDVAVEVSANGLVGDLIRSWRAP